SGAAAVSVVLLALSFVLLLFVSWVSTRGQRHAQ
nr:molybdate ABC transporter permease subunit [Solirubrobacterales bacterium]